MRLERVTASSSHTPIPVDPPANQPEFFQITLSDGTIAQFRDMTGADLKFVEVLQGGNVDGTMRLASRLCIRWGDRPGVALPQLEKLRARDLKTISQRLEALIAPLELETEELPDYSRRVALPDGTIAQFRDMTGADLKFVEALQGSKIDGTMQLIGRLCTCWGDRPGVEIAELEALPARILLALSQVVDFFLSEPDQ